MNIYEYIKEEKELHSLILKFIDEETENLADFRKLSNIFNSRKIQENRNDLLNILRMILVISNDHHRSLNFYQKIEKILMIFKNAIKQTFSQQEIFYLFQTNKRILLFFLNEEIITLDKKTIECLYDLQYFSFAPEIKKFYEAKEPEQNIFYKALNRIFHSTNNDPESIILDNLNYILNQHANFEKNRNEGENHLYICQLIRKDSIDDFIQYINQYSINISSIIEPSIFESNLFLLDKKPSLIEYAAFFGSIQIFKYLNLNKAQLTPELWIYAIHGRNPEIIQFLEDNQVKPPNNSYFECFIESIKCHHNEITNYIVDNLLDQNQHDSLFWNDNELMLIYALWFLDYEQIPENINDHFLFCYLCKFNQYRIVKLLVESKNIGFNINDTVI